MILFELKYMVQKSGIQISILVLKKGGIVNSVLPNFAKFSYRLVQKILSMLWLAIGHFEKNMELLF